MPAPREAPAPPTCEPPMQVNRYSQWVRWLSTGNVSVPNLSPEPTPPAHLALRRTMSAAHVYAPAHEPSGIIIHLGDNVGSHSESSSDGVLSSHSSRYSDPDNEV